MKILYGIQGTGNGHISRARTFLPLLKQVADVDILLSGTSSDIELGHPVRFKKHGLSYAFGNNGKIDFIKTASRLKLGRLKKDIKDLPIHKYDLIISDFEPITSWAAKSANKLCVGLSHQSSFLSPKVPRPSKRSAIGENIFKHYAPCQHHIGFHYQKYDETIYTPIINQEIRKLRRNTEKGDGNLERRNHYAISGSKGSSERPSATVYLPSYDDQELIWQFQSIDRIDWHVFSKKAKEAYRIDHIHVHPVDFSNYITRLDQCDWLLCGAGFETPSEGLFLGKPMLVIPMQKQYEQQCNAVALEKLGVTVMPRITSHFPFFLSQWLDQAKPIIKEYPEESQKVIQKILHFHEQQQKRNRHFVEMVFQEKATV